jgi:hypothetical protein
MTDTPIPQLQPSPIRLPQQWEWQIMQEYANAAVKSGLVGSSMTKEQAFFVILKGYELGITPMQALAEIHLIKGKPGLSVQLMIGLANRSGMLSAFDIPDAAQALKEKKATVCAIRRDRPDSPVSMTFTMEDAQAAGLLSNPTWKQYPGQMLINRAVSMLLRRVIPEALSGMYLAEELENSTFDAPAAPALSAPQNAQIPAHTITAPTMNAEASKTPASAPADTKSTPETPADWAANLRLIGWTWDTFRIPKEGLPDILKKAKKDVLAKEEAKGAVLAFHCGYDAEKVALVADEKGLSVEAAVFANSLSL